MNEEVWATVLRSAGFSETASQIMHDMQQTLYGKISTKSLSLEERLDIRYLKNMVSHEIIPFVHPFHQRHEYNQRALEESEDTTPFKSTHECVMCECGSPTQLINLLKEWKSPLSRLDWKAHNINGPRLIMIRRSELVSMFKLSPKEGTIMRKAIKVCKTRHTEKLLESQEESA